MKNPFLLLVFTAILTASFGLGGCGEKQRVADKNQIVWIKNDYARFFRLGYTASDSFLELFADENGEKVIGKFHWGKSSHISGYQPRGSMARIVSLSSIHTSMLAELSAHKTLVGVESQKYIAHPSLSGTPELKRLAEVAPDGPIIPEKLALCSPTIVLGTLSSIEDKQTIERLSLNKFSVYWCQNHLENHPLGRSEWLIALGWICGKPTQAQEKFNRIRADYESLVEKAKAIKSETPTVITNCVYNGMWFVPQFSSFVSQLIRDAGGKPISAEAGSGSNVISIEKAVGLFAQADIWINTDLCTSLDCLRSSDPRVAHIKAFRRGRVYHFNKQLQTNGSNAYWDMGCIYPNRILSDLFHIFQNNLQSDSLNYYDICR